MRANFEDLCKVLENIKSQCQDMDILDFYCSVDTPIRDITPSASECMATGRELPTAKEFEHTGKMIIDLHIQALSSK